jgi:osmoprotectant transport system ATP-binding protein
VTHDIDEAIKMGDKIAVMKQGGHLAQYAMPAELLMSPADEFVEDFVGADRALKRLALQRVADIDLWKAPLVKAGERVSEVREKIADADIDIPLLVDDQGRPQGWLSERGLTGERVRPELRSQAEPIIDIDAVLRDALGYLLAEETRYGPVTDHRGCVVGVLSLDLIAHALQIPATDVPSAGDVLAHDA